MSPRTWAACRNPVFDHGGSVRPPPPIPIPNSHPARALCSALLILLVAAVLPSPAHAVQYKASIAGNASTLNSVPAGWTTEDGTGFSVGMDFQFQKGILFFQPGVHYEQLGFRLEEVEIGPDMVRDQLLSLLWTMDEPVFSPNQKVAGRH